MIRAWVASLAALARDWVPASARSLPKPVPSKLETVVSAAPEPLGTPTRAIRIRESAIAEIAAPARRASDWKIPQPPPGVAPKGVLMAMDDAMSGNFGWLVASQFSEGLEFFGYPYLAELTQRAEYRRPAEIIAKAMTMKWIKLQATGETDKSDKIKEIEEALETLQAQERFQIMALHDGFFGRGQLFIDMGTTDTPGELKTPLTVTREKIDSRGIRNLQPIEAMWSYPNQYNSNEPLKKDFFKPETWFVMGDEVHHTRLMTMVSRPVPDMLKPTYAFGGLSLTQIMKPYVDNWLRTRQSISDLIHNFSVMALKTDLGDVLNMGTGQQIFNRADLFNKARDNRGLFLLNKDTEELANISVPLGTLDALQAQVQEHMAAVSGIPLIILFGITPSGLNATADPELKEFARNTLANQEDLFRPPITRVIRMIQIAKWGGWDPEITFKFEPLMPEDMKELADTLKTKAETDEVLINAGVITPVESRQRIADEEDSPYSGLDVSMVPEPPGPEGQGMGLPGLGEGGEPGPNQPPNPNPEAAGAPNGVKPNGAGPNPFGHDEWIEGDHPRDDIGQFSETAGGGGGKFDHKANREKQRELLQRSNELRNTNKAESRRLYDQAQALQSESLAAEKKEATAAKRAATRAANQRDLFAEGGKDKHGFERAPGLDERGRKAEQKFYNAIRKNSHKLIDVYQHKFGNLVDPDKVKQLSTDFLNDRKLAPAVHEPSSLLSKLIFTDVLKKKESAGDTSPTIFTAGGSGSGKSEAMHVAKTVLGLQGTGSGFDSTLSNPKSAMKKIDETLASTKGPVTIIYTNTPLEKAFRFNAGRDRSVPAAILVQAHLGASHTVLELATHYADNPRVHIRVINNAGELHEIAPGSLADVPQYNESDVARMNEVARSMFDKGEINEQKYKYLVGSGSGS